MPKLSLKILQKALWNTTALVLTAAIWLSGCRLQSTPTKSPHAPSPTPVPTATPYTIYMPGIEAGEASPLDTPSPLTTPTPPPSPTPLPPPVPKPDYGVQIHLFIEGDLVQPLEWARGLGVGWVKQQVMWHTVEHGPDNFDWRQLDRIVEGCHGFGFKLLLGVIHAPDWTRAVELETGPPIDYAEFGRFMEQMAARYRGRVAAYELWNEPNLAREWRGDTLDPARFVALVQEGAGGVRRGDPEALVISGAPAVTGINDGETAIDDRVFLRGMYESGVSQWVDGIGAHPYGYANPPDERWQDASHTAPSHNEHPSFFFLDTLEDYRAIMLEYGDEETQIWVTEFGWPTVDNLPGLDVTGLAYARHVSEAQQAEYIVRAFRLGDERAWVGPMFLWNLNLAPIWGTSEAFSAYSVLRSDGDYRPAYIDLRLAEPGGP